MQKNISKKPHTLKEATYTVVPKDSDVALSCEAVDGKLVDEVNNIFVLTKKQAYDVLLDNGEDAFTSCKDENSIDVPSPAEELNVPFGFQENHSTRKLTGGFTKSMKRRFGKVTEESSKAIARPVVKEDITDFGKPKTTYKNYDFILPGYGKNKYHENTNAVEELVESSDRLWDKEDLEAKVNDDLGLAILKDCEKAGVSKAAFPAALDMIKDMMGPKPDVEQAVEDWEAKEEAENGEGSNEEASDDSVEAEQQSEAEIAESTKSPKTLRDAVNYLRKRVAEKKLARRAFLKEDFEDPIIGECPTCGCKLTAYDDVCPECGTSAMAQSMEMAQQGNGYEDVAGDLDIESTVKNLQRRLEAKKLAKKNAIRKVLESKRK